MKKALLVGDPVAHSLSPKLHRLWLEQYNIEAEYTARRTTEDELPKILDDIRSGKLVGMNVTIPHKEKIFGLIKTLTAAAKATGAVNTVYRNEKGDLVGDNTDVEGFLENLKREAPNWIAEERTTLILGCGGSARAVVYALLKEQVGRIFVAGRRQDARKALQASFNRPEISPIPWDEIVKIAPKADLIVNATPLGLPGHELLAFDTGLLKRSAVVYDLVYGTESTSFLKSASTRGLVTCNGLGMLVFQAAPAFEKWFGIRPTLNEDLLNTLINGN